jgi:YVTN family beta-propeller protein
LAVNRAARICAAGYGGQVLVSQATQTLLEDEEEDLAVSLRDLGEQRLKDLDRAVRLYQVTGPGLATDFPPLRGQTDAAAPSVAPPLALHRRRAVLIVAGVFIVSAAAFAVLLLGRLGGGGLSQVHPNNVAVIDPATNHVVDEVPVGIRPGPIAAAGDSIWVGNVDDRTLTRINGVTRANAGTISLENQSPTGLAIGEGAVWVAHGFLGTLSRVDIQFGRLTQTRAVTGPSSAGAVAFGGGAVWAVFGESTLARIDPASVRLTGRGLAGGSPDGIVFAGGAVWVVNSSDQTVTRFDPGTFDQGSVRPVSVGRKPSAIAFGFDALWVADEGDDVVTRIEPDTYSVFTIGEVGHEPVAIASGAGAIWVASRDGTIARIDPDRRKVTGTIHVGNIPSGIAVAGGRVWVTVQAP